MELNRKQFLVSSCQLDLTFLKKLFKLTDKIKKISSSDKGLSKLNELISHKRAVLFFNQPSTRTFLSFANACHMLGIKISDVRDSSKSSEAKGESFEDTILTMSNYADMIIMRHELRDSSERAAETLTRYNRRTLLINAGSGSNEHPTQALLDVYTMQQYFKLGKEKINLLICGDLKRGRAVNSLIYLITKYPKLKLTLVSPEKFKINESMTTFLAENNIKFDESNDLNACLADANVVYMTRIQDEYDVGNESKEIDLSSYSLSQNNINLVGKNSIILHPLPRRSELSPEIDFDSRAKFWEQEENGLWIRAALLVIMFKVDKNI